MFPLRMVAVAMSLAYDDRQCTNNTPLNDCAFMFLPLGICPAEVVKHVPTCQGYLPFPWSSDDPLLAKQFLHKPNWVLHPIPLISNRRTETTHQSPSTVVVEIRPQSIFSRCIFVKFFQVALQHSCLATFTHPHDDVPCFSVVPVQTNDAS